MMCDNGFYNFYWIIVLMFQQKLNGGFYDTRGRILGRNWYKSPESFPPCNSQSLYKRIWNFDPPPFLSKNGLQLVFNENIVYGNLNSENSQRYAENSTKLYLHEFGFCSESPYWTNFRFMFLTVIDVLYIQRCYHLLSERTKENNAYTMCGFLNVF